MRYESRSDSAQRSYYADPERESRGTLQRQMGLFLSERVMRTVVDTLTDPLLVLNDQRQLVYANRAALKIAGAESIREVLGLRPGELLGCEHAREMPGGCGTTEFCATCGAVQVILSSLKGKEELQECRITTADGNAYDLLVHGRPLELSGEHFNVFSIRDISHEKRRRMLERLFYHDLLNTAGGLQGMSQLLGSIQDDEEFERTKQLIHGLAGELIEEIEAQRDITAAENNELQLNIQRLQPDRLMEEVAAAYRTHGSAQYRSIRTEIPHRLPEMESDPRLLRRILGNMLKNALEATPSGGAVTAGAVHRSDGTNGEQERAEGIEFWVHNVRSMPRKVQLQVFQRSFSTKENDRGLGTYSMRLLAEHYLGGRVWFTSSEEEGTTFYARFPLRREESGRQQSGAGQ